MKKTTIYEMFMNGKYETLIEMVVYSCGCDEVRLPLDDYYEPIDGDLEEYFEDYLVYKYAEDYDEIETTKSSLILVIRTEAKCRDCKQGKVYMSSLPKPVGFEDVMLFHGILAYQRQANDYEGAKQHLNKVLTIPTYETCCSTEALGQVGVVLEGTVVLASNCDLCSGTDEKGRFFYKNNVDMSHIIYDADYLTFGTDGMNDEIVTKENKIKAVWMKENANDEERALAEELAALYNVELMIEELTEADKNDLEWLERYGF